MQIGLWSRWLALHGVPRAFLGIQARRGDPMAALLANHGRPDDPYPLMEAIRQQGPLVRKRYTWATVDTACAGRYCGTTGSASPTRLRWNFPNRCKP